MLKQIKKNQNKKIFNKLFVYLFLFLTVSAANNTMQYGQNISIPYSQPQSDLNFLNAAASVDHKGKIHPKIERDREEGNNRIRFNHLKSITNNLSTNYDQYNQIQSYTISYNTAPQKFTTYNCHYSRPSNSFTPLSVSSSASSSGILSNCNNFNCNNDNFGMYNCYI